MIRSSNCEIEIIYEILEFCIEQLCKSLQFNIPNTNFTYNFNCTKMNNNEINIVIKNNCKDNNILMSIYYYDNKFFYSVFLNGNLKIERTEINNSLLFPLILVTFTD